MSYRPTARNLEVNIHEKLVEDAVTSKVKTTSSDIIIRLKERIFSATMTMYSTHC